MIINLSLAQYYTSAEVDSIAAGLKKELTVEVDTAAGEQGILKKYVIKQGGISLGTIDIPKDFLLKDAFVGVASEEDVAAGGKLYGQGFVAGDKYLELDVNVEDESEDVKPVFINLKDIAPVMEDYQKKIYVDEQGLFTKEVGSVTLTPSGTQSNSNIFYIVDNNFSSMKMGNTFVSNEVSNYSIYDIGVAPESYEYIQIESQINNSSLFLAGYIEEEPTPTGGSYHPIEINKWYEFTEPIDFASTAGTKDKSGEGKHLYLLVKKDGDKYYGMLSTSNVIESSANEYLTKFKTINGESVLGEGNIEIQGVGSSITETDGILTDGTYEWYDKSKADLEIAESIEGLENATDEKLEKVNEFIEELNEHLDDVEKVTSIALNELNDRINNKQDKLSTDARGIYVGGGEGETYTASSDPAMFGYNEDDDILNFTSFNILFNGESVGTSEFYLTNENRTYAIISIPADRMKPEATVQMNTFVNNVPNYYIADGKGGFKYLGTSPSLDDIDYFNVTEFLGSGMYVLVKFDGENSTYELSATNTFGGNVYVAEFKTINGESVLGSGNIEIQGGSNIQITESEGVVSIDTGESGETIINATPDLSTGSELRGMFLESREDSYLKTYYSEISKNVIIVEPYPYSATERFNRGYRVAYGFKPFGKDFCFRNTISYPWPVIEWDVWYDMAILTDDTSSGSIFLPPREGEPGTEDVSGKIYIVYDEATGTAKYKYSKNNEVPINATEKVEIYTKEKSDELLAAKQDKLSGNYVASFQNGGGFMEFQTYDFKGNLQKTDTVNFKTINNQSIFGAGNISAVSSSDVVNIVKMSKEQYESLTNKSATTLYLIEE